MGHFRHTFDVPTRKSKPLRFKPVRPLRCVSSRCWVMTCGALWVCLCQVEANTFVLPCYLCARAFLQHHMPAETSKRKPPPTRYHMNNRHFLRPSIILVYGSHRDHMSHTQQTTSGRCCSPKSHVSYKSTPTSEAILEV